LRTRGRGDLDAGSLEFADDPLVAPVRILVGEAEDHRPQRRCERRPTRRPVRVPPAAGHELAVPAQQCVRLHRKRRPRGPGQRAAQGRQQRTICLGQLRPRGLAAKDGEFVAQDEDLQLLRATPAAEQTDEREQVPDNEIDKRPEQAALPHHDDEQPNLATLGRAADEFANPTGGVHGVSGEANDVRITSSNQLLGGGPIEIADAGATIDPVWPRFHWWGCEPLGDGVKRSSRGFWTRWFPCRPSRLVSLTRSGNEQLRRRRARAPS